MAEEREGQETSQQRNAKRDAARWRRAIDYILQYWPKDPGRGLEALLTGHPETTRAACASKEGDGARTELPWSVKARQLDLFSLLLSGLIQDLNKSNLYSHWTSGGADFDRDVARALWQLGPQTTEIGPKVPAQAGEMAKLIAKYEELALQAQLQQAGGLDHYVGALISHSHDPLRLMRAGKAAWVAFVEPLVDEKAFKEQASLRDTLDDVWENITFIGYAETDLRFKEADGWTAYNARFGFGSLREAIVAGLERAARRTGMLAVFGTDPEKGLEGIIFALKQSGLSVDPSLEKRLDVTMAELAPAQPLSSLNLLVRLDIAEAAAAELRDLGAALFPDEADIPAFGTDVAFRGTTLFQAIDADLLALASGTGISSPDERVAFAAALTAFCRGLKAALAARFEAADNPPGRAMELLRQLLKLNVSHWWTEAMREAAYLAMRILISKILKRKFDDLDPGFSRELSYYGVAAEEWEALRVNNRLAERGPSHSAQTSRAATEAIERFARDRLAFVGLEPDAPDHSLLGRGVADFSAEGELLRFMAKLRTFRAPVPPKPLAPVAAELETDRVMKEGLVGGDFLAGMANLLIWLVLLDRLSAFAADAADGAAPTSGQDIGSWFEAAMHSGALGFCSDFLFGETTRLNALPLSAYVELRHPAIASALAIWREARDGKDVRDKLAVWAKQAGTGDVGLEKLQVTRRGLNSTLRHHLQDMMSPGYLPRMLKAMETRSADAYWRMPDGV